MKKIKKLSIGTKFHVECGFCFARPATWNSFSDHHQIIDTCLF